MGHVEVALFYCEEESRWGAASFYLWNGTLSTQKYAQILQTELDEIGGQFHESCNIMDDNAPVHRAPIVGDFKRDHAIRFLPC